MCIDRGEEESQLESVPGTGACFLPGTLVSNAFYRGGHKAPVDSPEFFCVSKTWKTSYKHKQDRANMRAENTSEVTIGKPGTEMNFPRLV